MKVKEVMRQAYVVEKNIGLAEAARLMSEKGIGSLIIVSKNKVKGIVTERDVLKHFGRSEKIFDVMSEDVVSVEPQDDVHKALDIMRERKVKRLPVVSNDNLVGILTLTDIAAHTDELEGDFFFD